MSVRFALPARRKRNCIKTKNRWRPSSHPPIFSSRILEIYAENQIYVRGKNEYRLSPSGLKIFF